MNETNNASASPAMPGAAWVWTGLLLSVGFGGLALISLNFTDGRGSPAATFLMVGVLAAAGGVYVWLFRSGLTFNVNRRGLVFLLAVGAVMRLLMLLSGPMWEVDYRRYMWDGAVLASGHNPYRYSPDDVSGNTERTPPEALRRLAGGPGSTLRQIHYSELRTVYPPGAQAVFALAHLLRPWSLRALRLVLLVFDVGTLLVLVLLLRELGLPLALAMLYWWNPLLVKETVNSAHMEAVALPFVLGALLLALRKRPVLSAALLALAVTVKLWPVVLLPVLLRPFAREPRKIVPALAAFALICCAAAAPVLAGGFGDESGLVAYGRRWQMNDSVFMLIDLAARLPAWALGLGTPGRGLIARAAAAALVGAWVLRNSWRPAAGPHDLCERCLLVVAGLFLLSPTQFPWYYLWMLPLLALRPRTSLLLLSALLPVYYLRFYFRDHTSAVAVFDYGLVWIEFAPVWVLLLIEWRRGEWRRGARSDSIGASEASLP